MLIANHVLRWCSTLLFVGSLLIPAAQATAIGTEDQETTGEQAAVVGFAERAAVQAVNFRQGDAEGFTRSRVDFTDSGWQDFMKHMQGFLDEKGAPTFTSSFVTSGNTKVLGEESGIVHLRIPGTLTQSNGPSKTTYRAALEVDAGGDPVKIQKLEQIACGGTSAACQ